ncbi:hypothetical protein KKE75_03875 [Patescibacteria group bacterium]|nr:hypothetical protein [Patescibacteria group bacterium]
MITEVLIAEAPMTALNFVNQVEVGDRAQICLDGQLVNVRCISVRDARLIPSQPDFLNRLVTLKVTKMRGQRPPGGSLTFESFGVVDDPGLKILSYYPAESGRKRLPNLGS